jgi:sugar/nucleoside kinase (ribokinase family)
VGAVLEDRPVTAVVVEGGLSRDHLVHFQHGARFGVPGGPGLYAALGALLTTRWLMQDRGLTAGGPSPQVRLYGPGADLAMRTMLADAGVDVESLPVQDESYPLWILTSAHGRRIVKAASGEQHELDEDPEDATIEHAPPRSLLNGASALLRCAPRDSGEAVPAEVAVVAVDPDQRQIARLGWEYLDDLARTATLFTPSRVHLKQLGGEPRAVAAQLRDRTNRSVVARLDEDGCLVLPDTGGVWHVAAAPTSVLDTTGAGDSHAGSLVAALAAEPGHLTLAQCAAIASTVAAVTLTDWGADALLRTRLADLGPIPDALSGVELIEQP